MRLPHILKNAQKLFTDLKYYSFLLFTIVNIKMFTFVNQMISHEFN